MRILLTNDDGIRAPGILALYRALMQGREDPESPLAPETQILIVAPETVQSATSHGVTFSEPLMSRVVHLDDQTEGVAVDGRPADCVKLALSEIWSEHFPEHSRPDLVISGMNAGANCGINVIYSGTVAAALEAAFLGVPSIAVSLHIGTTPPDFDLAALFARRTIDHILRQKAPEQHDCLNVNIPRTDGSRTDMPPIAVCPMNTHGLVDRYERRVSPAGDAYYWASGHGLDFHSTEPGSDVDRLMRREITVTPLAYDLTDHGRLRLWRDVLGEAGAEKGGHIG